MNPNTPSLASASSAVRLYYSKPRAVFVLGANLLASLWIAYLLVAGLVGGHLVLLLTGVAVVFVAGPVIALHIREPIRALTRESAIVTLDIQGVTDVRQKVPFVAWEDVGQISLGTRSQTRAYLIFDFRHPPAARGPSQSHLRFFARFALSLGDWHVNLRPLKCNTAEVLRAARRLHQQAIRNQVVAKNGGSTQGWSGQLR